MAVRTLEVPENIWDNLPTEKYCYGCRVPKSTRQFFSVTPRKTPEGVKWVLKSRCKECLAADTRHKKEIQRQDIYSKRAPIEAAKELIETNPVAFAELIRRFRVDYQPLLAKHREVMQARIESQAQTNRRIHGRYVH